MDFTLRFNMDNDSFVEYPGSEICNILDIVSGQVLNGFTFNEIKDINENTIGEWEIKI